MTLRQRHRFVGYQRFDMHIHPSSTTPILTIDTPSHTNPSYHTHHPIYSPSHSHPLIYELSYTPPSYVPSYLPSLLFTHTIMISTPLGGPNDPRGPKGPNHHNPDRWNADGTAKK